MTEWNGGAGPRIVAIGGGTGLSTMLRGLKSRTRSLTAIVTVADDGGGSGMLRQDLLGNRKENQKKVRLSGSGRFWGGYL